MNATYTVESLSNFMKIFKKKSPIMAAGDWFLHWDNAPVHTAAIVTDWLVARCVQLLEHLPHSSELAPPTSSFSPR